MYRCDGCMCTWIRLDGFPSCYYYCYGPYLCCFVLIAVIIECTCLSEERKLEFEAFSVTTSRD